MSKDYPKPVENGELRASVHKLYLCAIGKYSADPKADMQDELQRLLAQEKAKWEQEIRLDELQKFPLHEDIDGFPLDHLSATYKTNRRAKLLDKENTK